MYKSVTQFLVVELLVVICSDAVLASPYYPSAIPSLEEAPVVQTVYGKVKGRVDTSRYNRSFYAFNGIPYAKPPVGERRFRSPLPPDSWNYTRDATKDGPMCIQTNYLYNEVPPVEGKEDCLYINVYTPHLPSKFYELNDWYPKKPQLPVMVFIHYGAFFAGTGNSDYLGPHYFMDKDVILVTFNYRLGVFGFLSTADDAAPGNWALKDQVAALKWVRDNIGAFGGNNKMVTLFGQSAGAGSTHYHLLSPTTKNLFHAAISQSGSTLALWARPQNLLQAQIAKQQAAFVGCDSQTDTHTMIKCLRKIDAETLAKSIQMFKFFSAEPFLIYGPVTEKRSSSNPNPYITEDPLHLIKKGKIHRVPWIVGVVEDEGILRASPLLRLPKVKEELLQKFDEIGPQILAVSLSVPSHEVSSTWKKITNFFLPTDTINVTEPASVQGFIDLYTDRSFTYGTYQSALLHAWRGHTPVWFYNFAYRGSYTYGNHFATTEKDIKFKWGVSHCDDLLYLFSSTRLFPPLDAIDVMMSDVMIELWTNFATYRHPTPCSDQYSTVWEPLPNLEDEPSVKNSDLLYLNITGPYKVEQGHPIKLQLNNEFNSERMHFWQSLPLSENIEGIE